jgi:hypothetical protein
MKLEMTNEKGACAACGAPMSVPVDVVPLTCARCGAT